VCDKRGARTEAVSRRDAADRDVQRMSGEENFSAARDRFETEIAAALFEGLTFASELGVQLALLSADVRR
jgi:hypothetical protein